MPVYHFPPNLKSKPVIIVWEVKDLAVIVTGIMVSFYFLLSSGFVLPGILVITYAVMTIRINEYTILSGVINGLNFFLIEPQEYDWETGELPAEKPQKEKKSKQKKAAPSNVDLALRRKRNAVLGLTAAAVMIAALAAGTGIYSYQKQMRKAAAEELQGKLYISFAGTDVLEYEMDIVDAKSLISGSYGYVTAEPSVIDCSALGSITISYHVSGDTAYGEEVSRTYQKTVEVKDTAVPVIELESETVILHVDQHYDILGNIRAVYDPVDGDLVKSDTLEYGTYTVTGQADLHHPGSYPITVDACDINGKNTTMIYFIEVHE